MISLRSNGPATALAIAPPLAKGVGEWERDREGGTQSLAGFAPKMSSLMHYRGKKGKGEVEGEKKRFRSTSFQVLSRDEFLVLYRSMAMLSATAPPSGERLGKHCRKSQECRITDCLSPAPLASTTEQRQQQPAV